MDVTNIPPAQDALDELQAYLTPTYYLDSDHPEVGALAKRATRRRHGSDRAGRASLLCRAGRIAL